MLRYSAPTPLWSRSTWPDVQARTLLCNHQEIRGRTQADAPIIYGRLDQELRYSSYRYLPAKNNSWFAINKLNQYKEILLLAAKDVLGLIPQFKDYPSASQFPSFALLVRLAKVQIVDNDEEIFVQANKDTKGVATSQFILSRSFSESRLINACKARLRSLVTLFAR